MTDFCPYCGGPLRITDTTRISWIARCVACHKTAQLDDNFDWRPHHWWNHPYLLVGLFVLILLVVSYLEANKWA